MSTDTLNPLDTEAFWTLMGAEDDEDTGSGESAGSGSEDDEDEDEDGSEALRDAGKKALEAERASAKRAREAYKPWAAIKREFGLTPEQVRERLSKPKTDEKDLDAVRREAAAEASQKANARILRAEIKGLAAKTFVDPADALAYLNLADFEVDDDGDVDTAEVERALADLLKRKPHLGKPTGKKSGAEFDGGARQSAPKKLGMNGLIRQSAGVNR